MRVLLVQPEDSPERGPWSGRQWDLIVDLGKSSAFSEERWGRQFGCPVVRRTSTRSSVPGLGLERCCRTHSSFWRFRAGWRNFRNGRR